MKLERGTITFYFSTLLKNLVVNLKRWSHGTLDIDDLNILPRLLKERDEEINS